MSAATCLPTLDLEASDVSGQKLARVRSVPADATVSELVQGLLGRMNLPRNDSSGRPMTWRARLERDGRHLLPADRVGDVLKPADRITLAPNIDAGGGAVRV